MDKKLLKKIINRMFICFGLEVYNPDLEKELFVT